MVTDPVCDPDDEDDKDDKGDPNFVVRTAAVGITSVAPDPNLGHVVDVVFDRPQGAAPGDRPNEA